MENRSTTNGYGEKTYIRKVTDASESIRNDRVEKGIKVCLQNGFDHFALDKFVHSFGVVVEKVVLPKAPDSSQRFVLFRFIEKFSADKIKSIPKYALPFGEVIVKGWFDDDRSSSSQDIQVNERINASQTFDEQLQELITNITPAENCMDKFNLICSDIYDAVIELYPNCLVRPFGSTFNGLALKDCSVDIFVDHMSNSSSESVINSIRTQIYKSKLFFEDMILITNVKMPFVKVCHKATGLTCYISCKNTLGVMNSHLIRCLVNLDPRIRPLILLIKHWAKYAGLTGVNTQISSYALTMKVLFFLQQIEGPLIPSVAYLQSLCKIKVVVDSWECGFTRVPPVPLAADNRTVADLLRGFFHYYSTFDFAHTVICPLLGRTVPKSVFLDTTLVPKEMALYVSMCAAGKERLHVGSRYVACIQDPFVLNHNVAQHVSSSNVDRMIACYDQAAKKCSKVSRPSELLPELFKPNNTTLKSSNNILTVNPSSNQNWNIILLIPDNIEDFPCSELAVEEAVYPWFQASYQFLILILEKLFGLKVLITHCRYHEECKSRPNKVCKVDTDPRSYVPSFRPPETISLLCQGYYGVMSGRNVAKKAFPETMSALRIEQRVTERAIALLKNTPNYEVVDFTCKFVPQMKPLRVVLEVSDRNTKKQMFRNWGIYMKSNILRVYNNHFQEYRKSLKDPTKSLFV